MSVAWRIAKRRYASLDGEGARLYGGRWNSKGRRMVYLGGSLSLAILETLVHLDRTLMPPDFVAVEVTIPDDCVETLEARHLPKLWRKIPGPKTLQAIGDKWLREGRSLALRVPSAVVPTESNVLVNPEHDDFKRIKIGTPSSFVFDPRLWK